MTAEIETLKAELERARGGKAEGDAGEDAIDELKQKAHLEARAIKKVLIEDREKFAATEAELRGRIK